MEKKKVTDFFSFFAPRFYVLTLILCFIVRIILLFSPLTEVNFTAGEWLKIFLLGPINDIAFATIALIPALIFYYTLFDGKYSKPASYIIEGALVAATLYFLLCNDITDEYGGPAPLIVNVLMSLFTICFSIKLFVPSVRKPWKRISVRLMLLLYVCCCIFIAMGEVVFWAEFGVRYNFIAVDYLVYTQEVIGNIIESYPMFWMMLGVLLVGMGICAILCRGRDISEAGATSGKHAALVTALVLAGAFAGGLWLHYGYRHLTCDNLFATELQENGCWDFLEAFVSNELDYEQFYPLLPAEDAEASAKELWKLSDVGVRHIADSIPELKKNIVLITIESLSADFLGTYGGTRNITPNLDTLITRSLVFDNLFATGNRTVRGLEALTLCTPPTAGESIVKRKENGGYFNTGEVLREKGYSTTFIYGGDSYFDNMGEFFRNNGYDIYDKASYDKDAMLFYNVWGTCDEDSYREALALFDRENAEGRPFFAHVMTISNHRPYTYPEGRIEGNPMTRSAAVQYTDYAIGDFLAKAEEHDWFDNTVFVIVADHCASSAGKTSLPLECYHIPAIIYAPGFIEPQRVSKTCSQVDLMPTLFSLLHFDYDSSFCGDDILADDFRERAYMATYQDLGYYCDDVLTVLSPVRRITQYAVERGENWTFTETLLKDKAEGPAHEAQANYQFTNAK